VLKLLSAAGTGAVFSRALVSLAADEPQVTEAMIGQAEWIAGIELTDDERKLMLEGVNELLQEFAELREVPLDNSVPPALLFEVRPGAAPRAFRASGRVRPIDAAAGTRPAADDDLAFLPVTQLGALLRTRQISSEELTRLYLDRLKRHDPTLRCVISLTEERALGQARRADLELSRGAYRGPLHGVPWGAKDLLAVPGYRTTWGARPYEEQVLAEEATVARRLDEAGAVLVAKLTLGALAWGDEWYGGQTKNPWNVEQGSSGSSAGSAAATAAGLVGFAIGSETWGSIVSPCTRCGATGLRPTFGRVSRHGAMALSWSMDKLGPITRSVEDCALVFSAIEGRDGLDPTAVSRPFRWPAARDVRALRIGYLKETFDRDPAEEIEDEEDRERAIEFHAHELRTLETLRGMGLELQPISLPDRYPISPLSLILTAEASTAFDDLTRSGRDDLLRRQVEMAWPNVLRQGQLIPAVEYLRANRIRALLMRQMEELLEGIDVYVSPSFAGDNLLLTNLTGHPCVVLPNGFRTSDGTPTSITFIGRPFGETDLLAVAHSYQQATDYHLQRPPP
jgi:Asp-tRNA(Asn)/Glu-tRNA(Gln) amidotransferase A subunit family amidase